MEIWRNIDEYEGLYQISNCGNVKSLSRKMIFVDGRNYNFKDKILKPGLSKNGYLTVSLNKNKNSKTFYVHRLVSKYFVENENGYNFVNHKDENKINNNYSNLEWCTRDYNNSYGSLKKRSSFIGKKVGMYKNGILLKCFDKIIDTEKYGFTPSLVSGCCIGKCNSHKKYQWKHL